ncbi:MAG TPA: sigma-70 family RNA polymerase sigma factor [Gemmatimonadaceae bacterium]|jgi:RNA polymerase sigma factor (sigma-70 family)|nr:sigma-70 family RNA polymerase sigma factor [Gemmatimonadaceae bacterium]
MSQLPPTLEALLERNPPTDEAWAAFAREYTALLMHVARSTSRGRDEAMDAYAYLLERLSRDGCQKLRSYMADPRSKFTTWLVVVSRRICIDHHRARYGRMRNEESRSERERLGLRRRLEDLDDSAEFEDTIADESIDSAAVEIERRELTNELACLRKELEPSDRLLIALRFDDGLPASEIATILRMPSQFHVYRRLNAVLEDMRRRLKARGYENAAS